MEFRETDQHVTFADQLGDDRDAPVVLINQFTVDPGEVERFLEVWAADARYMRAQPGFISTQLHRGTAGSTSFVNTAVWESAGALAAAVGAPEFRVQIGRYPDGTVAAPHVFRKEAVAGVCTG